MVMSITSLSATLPLVLYTEISFRFPPLTVQPPPSPCSLNYKLSIYNFSFITHFKLELEYLLPNIEL